MGATPTVASGDRVPAECMVISANSQGGKARVTAIARSNYGLYTTTGSKVVTDRFGTIEGYKPYRGEF